jgi:hypothetical protein
MDGWMDSLTFFDIECGKEKKDIFFFLLSKLEGPIGI